MSSRRGCIRRPCAWRAASSLIASEYSSCTETIGTLHRQHRTTQISRYSRCRPNAGRRACFELSAVILKKLIHAQPICELPSMGFSVNAALDVLKIRRIGGTLFDRFSGSLSALALLRALIKSPNCFILFLCFFFMRSCNMRYMCGLYYDKRKAPSTLHVFEFFSC